MHTGDPVKGTLTTSSALSMFLVTAIGGTVAFYLRGRLKLAALVVLAGWLFLPTTINETKATLLLLPVALLVPAFLMPHRARLLSKMLPIVGVGLLAGTAFVVSYNALVQYGEYGGPLGEFFTNSDSLRYLYTGAANTEQPYVGRLDSIEIALEYTSQDPLRLAFGYGAGNVSESFLPEFAGRYSDYYLRFGVGQTQVTTFLWEIGVVGLVAYLFRDFDPIAGVPSVASHTPLQAVALVLAVIGALAFGAVLLRAV